MNDIEGAGEVITGGVIARAVEPRDGEPGAGEDSGHTQEAACLNCTAPLAGPYCQACGQRAHVHRTLTAFWHDLLHGVLHFEGKIWHTLPLLAWRPGELTRRYIDGERARFVSPMALFLFSIFLMFGAFSLTGGPVNFSNRETKAEFRQGLTEGIQEADAKRVGIEAERAKAAAAGGDTAAIDARLKDVRDEISMLRLMRERGIAEAGITRASDDLPGAPGWLSDAYRKAKSNPSLLLYKLQTNAYKFSWALIPISVPFLWLLFPFSKRFRVYDHTVFVTYSLAFVTLFLVTLSLLHMVGFKGAPIALPLLIVPPVHMYRQLRGTYGLRWLSALLRTVLLLIFAALAATLFTSMLVVLGVLG